jgi:hypothetical protein
MSQFIELNMQFVKDLQEEFSLLIHRKINTMSDPLHQTSQFISPRLFSTNIYIERENML